MRRFLSHAGPRVGAFAWLFFLTWGSCATEIVRPQDDLRGRFEPGLIVETGARLGNCDVLTFTPDGQFLLAAGDDKVVRVWKFSEKGLEKHDTLRWSIWRERRGAIYAMALSPDPEARHLVIGGLGVITGALVVLDRATGHVVHALTDTRGNNQVIWTVAFSPSGKQVAFGTNDGGVWLWRLDSGRPNDVRLLGKHDGKPNPVNLVSFISNSKLISAASDGQVLQWDISGPHPTPTFLFRFDVGEVYKTAISPDRHWLIAAGQRRHNNIELCSLDGKTRKRIRLEKDDLPHSMAFDARSKRLALGIRTVPQKADFFKEIDDKILLYDLADDKHEPAPGPKPTFHPEALAFHRDGFHLAVAGGNDHEVTLWDLRKHAEEPVSVIRSPGSGIWRVGLSADGQYLGYQTDRNPNPPHPNSRGQGPWKVFNLHRRQMAMEASFEPIQPLQELGGWTVQPTDNAYQWNVVGPAGTFPLPLNRDPDDMPRCYTFLGGKNTKPIRLAVGHYWGISVFELGESGPRRVRLMTGHQSWITSIAPSRDHKMLVSASRDQTIAAWSLADWPHQPELGAAFDIRQQKLLIDQVAPGSPAWEAGLLKGDEIVVFAFDANRFLFDPGNRISPEKREQLAIQKIGTAEECLVRLQHPEPGKQFYFKVMRGNQMQPEEKATSVRQRPIWCFFPTRADEWVLWRYLDYFYDTSTQGDSLIGWQVSGAVDQTPAFYDARQFAAHFHRPDKVADAIEKTRFAPERSSIPEMEPPELTLQADAAEIQDRPVNLRLKVTPRGNRDFHRPDHLLLWIGDFQFKEWPREALPADGVFQQTVSIPTSLFRSGVNRVTLQCYGRGGGIEKKQIVVRKLGRPAPPRLHLMLVGVGDYGDCKISPRGLRFGNLPGVYVDVVRMKLMWLDQKDRLFQDVQVYPLEDAAASPKNILQLFDTVAKKAAPDDLAVLFLGGHGYSEPAGQRDVFKSGTFVFVGPHFDFLRPTETGLASEDLYRSLTRIPCRKLVLLNACHSGDATISTLRDPVRDLTPGGVGPVVLSACDPKEPAFVADQGSLFTRAIHEALTSRFAEADLDRNNQVDTLELAQFVRSRVPQLLQEAKAHDRIADKDKAKYQTPCFYPEPGLMERFPIARQGPP